MESGSTSGVSARIISRTSPADGDIFLHVGPDHHRVGAGFQRLEHRHGRAHAERAGDVAGGGDDAALAAADDDRLVGEGGIVAFLDGGVEGVAVDMGDGKHVALGMTDKARAAADAAAARGGAGRLDETVAAKCLC